MKRYNKLIRDFIPEIIKKDNKKFDIHIASNKDYTYFLNEKLKEEVNEYLKENNIEELSDILELLISLSKNLGFTEKELFNERLKKKNEKVGFDKKIILDKIY